MKNKIRLFLFLFLFFIPKITVSANDINGSSFGIKPIYPSTQDSSVGESGYFKLNLKPNQKEKLKVEVKNYSDNKITVLMSVNRAGTAKTGLILYDTTANKESKIKLNNNENFEKMIDKHVEEIELEPLQHKTVSIGIQTPKDAFEGEILGGIHFKEKKDHSKSDKMVTNTFSYSIPIIIIENLKPVENELSLREIKTGLRNYHPFIEAVIENNAPSIIKEMSIDGEIYSLKNDEKWYTQKLQKLQMAPHSAFSFGFDLKDTEFIPGDYKVDLIVNADGKKYHFEKEFSITNKEANEKNESSVHITKKTNNNLVYIIISICLLLIVLGALLFFIPKKRKKKGTKKGEKKRKKRKKRKKD